MVSQTSEVKTLWTICVTFLLVASAAGDHQARQKPKGKPDPSKVEQILVSERAIPMTADTLKMIAKGRRPGGAASKQSVDPPPSFPSGLMLYSRVKVTCAFLYAKHEHETYVEQNGKRFAVEKLTLISNIGGDRQNKDGSNTSQVARTEEEFNMGCRRSCVSGRATHMGVTWVTQETCQ
jgi:hypothetical protein